MKNLLPLHKSSCAFITATLLSSPGILSPSQQFVPDNYCSAPTIFLSLMLDIFTHYRSRVVTKNLSPGETAEAASDNVLILPWHFVYRARDLQKASFSISCQTPVIVSIIINKEEKTQPNGFSTDGRHFYHLSSESAVQGYKLLLQLWRWLECRVTLCQDEYRRSKAKDLQSYFSSIILKLISHNALGSCFLESDLLS